MIPRWERLQKTKSVAWLQCSHYHGERWGERYEKYGLEHQLTTNAQGPNETMCTEGFDVGMDVLAHACLTFLDNILLVKCVHCSNKALGGFCLWTTTRFTENST